MSGGGGCPVIVLDELSNMLICILFYDCFFFQPYQWFSSPKVTEIRFNT